MQQLYEDSEFESILQVFEIVDIMICRESSYLLFSSQEPLEFESEIEENSPKIQSKIKIAQNLMLSCSKIVEDLLSSKNLAHWYQILQVYQTKRLSSIKSGTHQPEDLFFDENLDNFLKKLSNSEQTATNPDLETIKTEDYLLNWSQFETIFIFIELVSKYLSLEFLQSDEFQLEKELHEELIIKIQKNLLKHFDFIKFFCSFSLFF